MAACRPIAKFGVLPLIAALVPPAAPWIAENPEAGVTIVCGLLAGIDYLVDRLAPRRAPAPPTGPS